MAFTGICWQQRNAEAKDSLDPFQLQRELAPSTHALLTWCSGIPLRASLPCCSLLCFITPAPLLPAFEVPVPGSVPAMALALPPPAAATAQSHRPPWDQSTSAHPSQLALEGASGSMLSWRDAAGLARTYVFCSFCCWSPALSWADVTGNHLKSHNIPNLQKFSQDIQKAHPEREDRPDMLKSPAPKLGGQ